MRTSNPRIRAFGIIVLLVFLCENSTWGQVFGRYQPGLAISASLSFSERFAQESSVFLRNDVLLFSDDSISSFFDFSLGYSRRSYQLDYSGPEMVSSTIPFYRKALTLQLLCILEFPTIPKVRKSLIPHIGFGIQQQFFNLNETDQRVYDYFGIQKINPRALVIEVGSEFVTHNKPRFYTAFQLEIPGTSQEGYRVLNDSASGITYEYYDKSRELCCVRVLIGFRI